MKNRILVVFAVAMLIAPLAAFAAQDAVPKNIIILIGDGMGTAQVSAARIVKDQLELDRCTVGGLVATHSADNFVTDSAAGGTALATGRRTNNGMIALAPDGSELKTLLEHAHEAGKASGVVVTCSITHATPATFLAHVESRRQQTLIAEQIAAGTADVLLGGGWGFFVPESVQGSKRNDNKDVLAELAKRMPVALTLEDLRALEDAESFAGMLAPDYLQWAEDRNPSLADMVAMALNALSKNPNGFALMVEGAHIDWAAHDNNETRVIGEMIDFDDAVGVALDFAETDGNTLVVVTSDHDTGGYAILDGSLENKTITKSAFATTKHSAEMVPLFACGPGAQALGGIRDNNDVGQLLIEYVQQSAAAPEQEEALAGAAP